MPPKQRKAGKRRRNKSSPGQVNPTNRHRGFKQHKLFNNDPLSQASTDVSDSEYFSDTSDFLTPSFTPPPTLITMGKLTSDDIDEIVAKLAPMIVKEIKAQLMVDVKELVESKTTKILGEFEKLRSDNTQLTCELAQTRRNFDDLEQDGRRMCLDMSGIPGDTGVFSENVEAKILENAKKCKILLHSSDIDRCHRKGRPKDRYNRKVIIKLTNSKARQRYYQARKGMGEGVFVQESLTPLRERLGYEARQLKRAGTLTNSWVAGSMVKAKLPGNDGKIITIRDMIDIQCTKEGKPLPEY